MNKFIDRGEGGNLRGAKPRWVRRLAIYPLFVVLFTALNQCSAPRPAIPITGLSSDFRPLRSQFNQDSGKVRLLLLLDPT